MITLYGGLLFGCYTLDTTSSIVMFCKGLSWLAPEEKKGGKQIFLRFWAMLHMAGERNWRQDDSCQLFKNINLLVLLYALQKCVLCNNVEEIRKYARILRP